MLGEEKRDTLKRLPENVSMFKCHNCKKIFDIFSESEGTGILIVLLDKEKVLCPECGSENTELMCKVDVYSVYLKLMGFDCRKDVMMSGTDICPICTKSMCPKCFNHSVVALSRVTGYIQDVNGWNEGKKQELLDRKRYTVDESNGIYV